MTSNPPKIAVVTGASGQDGYYLSKKLAYMGYIVYATSRFGSKLRETFKETPNIFVIQLDLTSKINVQHFIDEIKPNIIYHLAAQSSVGKSYSEPLETLNSCIIPTLNILDALRSCGNPTKFVHLSSSECFNSPNKFIDEHTPLNPTSPYGQGKATASEIVVMYRNLYRLSCVNLYCFNHESPRRPKHFVTQKIVNHAYSCAIGEDRIEAYGNINIVRDWGWAEEYVEAMILIGESDHVEDFVIGTGIGTHLSDFIKISFEYFGLDCRKFIAFDESLVRRNDCIHRVSNPRRIKEAVGWEAQSDVTSVIHKLCEHIIRRSSQ